MSSSGPDPAAGGDPAVDGDPAAALERLAGSTRPYLIGVRHHSPALSVALPELLDAADPEVLLLELPVQFRRWLPWLADAATTAPVALAGATEPVWFYPYADFSPELVAVRWAHARGVEVVPFDLPLGDPGWSAPGEDDVPGPRPLSSALREGASGRGDDDLWDRVVEAAAPGNSPEQVRRAALAVGWALRADDGTRVREVDLRREAYMRSVMRSVLDGRPERRVVALLGAYHAPALVAGEATAAAEPTTGSGPVPEVVTSLVPYADHLLDERSGYPAGIRDPRWQAMVLRSGGDPARIGSGLVDLVVRICSGIRARGHPAGPAEAREVVRLAGDLARLRGLPAPARGELVEALTTVLVQGEPTGRGRVVAQAMDDVLVGPGRGTLAAGTPRCGLAPAVEEHLRELGLPNPSEPQGVALRLDPLRGGRDARREIALHRLGVCGVPYGTAVEVQGVGGAAALTTRWEVAWTPTTAAMLEVAGVHGVTLEQAAGGVLRAARARQAAAGGPTPREVLDGLTDAVRCALDAVISDRLDDVAAVLPASGTMAELLEGLDLVTRLTGMSGVSAPSVGPVSASLHEAAVRQVDGLSGSTDVADARALAALATRHADQGLSLRLDAALHRTADTGSPLMRGAACGVRVLLGLDDPAEAAERVAAWPDLDDAEQLRGRLTGLLSVAGPLLEAGGQVLDPLLHRLETLPDPLFLRRLPWLRGGFDVLSPAARDRLLDTVTEQLGQRLDLQLDVSPELLARWAAADAYALDELRRRGLVHAVSLAPADRWRLILGRRRETLPRAGRRLARALDELYGTGRGEGSRGGLAGSGGSGGDEAPYPGVREWSAELIELFGPMVREEVLAAAAGQGRVDAALALDPAAVRPSVDLLTSVLSLAGALPEAALARLRPLVARVTAELTRELATQLRPALAGIATARPTRRPTGRLDLRRTLDANLSTARISDDGQMIVLPERPVFAGRARRATDWRIVLVVDVSGSMEASTVWSAITAAVLAGVPALTTHLLAFSTEVIDLSGLVDDPLSLLLEVSVGGGTSILTGLAAAARLVTVPSRTLIVVVSDFEDGGPPGPLLAQVRALVDSGVHLLGCASLDDTGAARYSVGAAEQLVAAGMPVAALSPLELARWVAEKLR